MMLMGIIAAVSLQSACVMPSAPMVPQAITTEPEAAALRTERMIYLSNSADFVECEFEAIDNGSLTDLQRASRQAALNQFFGTRDAYTDDVAAVLDAYAQQ